MTIFFLSNPFNTGMIITVQYAFSFIPPLSAENSLVSFLPIHFLIKQIHLLRLIILISWTESFIYPTFYC